MATHVMEGYPTAQVFTGGVDWRAVFAGALAGFAVTLILMTLGAAIGISAADAADGGDGRAFGIGAGIWWLFTALVAGVIGGRVVSRAAYRDPAYSPALYGTLTWIVGAIVLMFLLAVGVGNMAGGLGAGIGAGAERGLAGGMTGSPADTARVVQQAADVGKGAAWGLLLSQLIGLGATVLAASKRTVLRERRTPAV